MNKLRLSYTKINSWLHCRVRYKYAYIDNLIPKKKVEPLQVGDITHRLLHEWITNRLTAADISNLDQLVRKLYPEDDEREVMDVAIQAAALIKGYIEKYRDDPLNFIPGETILEVDLGPYILTGRVDAWARTQDGRLWRVEHKTAAKMDSQYLQGLKGGLQGAIYDYLSEQLFKEPITGVVYNLLIKTKIPDYHRAYTKRNPFNIERMLKTVEGVYRDIQRGDIYPSSLCYSYNRECDYKMLCEYNSEEVRRNFYAERKEVTNNGAQTEQEGPEGTG